MMPQLRRKPPKYCHHKPSGQAVVYLNRQPVYLGRHESQESHEKYARVIAEWTTEADSITHQRQREYDIHSVGSIERLSVNQILLAYFKYAKGYYVDASGASTKEYQEMIYAARPLRKLCGSQPACGFGPKTLKALQQHMVESGLLCRQTINHRINRIRRIFSWAVSEELVPAGLHEALRTVPPLKRGRTVAREAPPVSPVAQDDIDAVVSLASPQIAAMIRLQQLGGMRPQDVVQLRLCDIDRSEDIWRFEPQHHKTQWRGHSRTIYLGPKAQELLHPLMHKDPNAFLFSPAESEQWRSEQRRSSRESPLTPSQRARTPSASRKRPVRECYDVDSYRRAIKYVILKANKLRTQAGKPPVPSWSPNQLRHARATEIRKLYGLEGAQLILGQKHARVTEVYAERDEELAVRIQREVG